MEKVLKALDLLRILDSEMPAQVTACFLYVASHKNCHKMAMEEYLDISTASGSRNTDWLSKKHRFGKEGLNLIEKVPDPANRRRLMLKLTDKGERLVKHLRSVLYD